MIHTLLAQNFDQFNPLVIGAGKTQADALSTPGGVISQALLFAFPIAGMILFVMILWGGFEMVYGATSSKGKDAGRQRITAAIIGFFLLFLSYWMARIVGYVFGIDIFGSGQ